MTITARLLAEIQRSGSTRESIAAVYRAGLEQDRQTGVHDYVDWPRVNYVLLRRYRPSGLRYIKARAWKPLEKAVR